ncbi:MAG: hypothetical protein Fur0042_11630 [Cyanophyceae cyanobacterium]
MSFCDGVDAVCAWGRDRGSAAEMRKMKNGDDWGKGGAMVERERGRAGTIAIAAGRCPNRWTWRGFEICYGRSGDRGPAVVLVHGFGASWRHWRKNLPFLGEWCRVFAIDLLGFGGSDKPDPAAPGYTFDTWGQQVVDFIDQVVGEPAFVIGNSIGCVVALQAAAIAPERVRAVALLNCSLRLLHDRRLATQPWPKRVGAPLLQRILKQKWLGYWFFRQLATPKTVRNILRQAYGDPAAVTDELVDILMEPAQDPGAADVFLAFTGYSQGPLPEDLLEIVTVPVAIWWGTADPWEPVELGRAFEKFPCVEKFVALEGVGHCPQDENPFALNYQLRDWIYWKAQETLPHDPLHPGDRVEVRVVRPDGDYAWNGLRGTVVTVGDRAVTVQLDDQGSKRHFYREDLWPCDHEPLP